MKVRDDLIFSLCHLSGAKKGREERFAGERIAIGRGRHNQCCFDPEQERTVSARHCEIRLEGIEPFIYDTGSLNGTYLNGRRVRRALLRDGDEIGLGREGPRIRFMLRSGKTPDSIKPGDLVIPEPIGRRITTREAPVSSDEESPGSPSWLRRPRILIAVLTLVVIALTATAVKLLLFPDPGGAEPSPRAPDGVEPQSEQRNSPLIPPRALPSGPRGATVLILGLVETQEGQVLGERDLGAGCIVAPELVVTTTEVLDAIRRFTSRRPEGATRLRVVVAPGGDRAQGVTVLYRQSTPDAGSGIAPGIALLHLAKRPTAAPLPRMTHGPSALGDASLFEPLLAEQKLTVRHLLDSSGARTTDPDHALLLRVGQLPSCPGLPIFSPDGSRLIGLGLGESHPDLALTLLALPALLAQADTLPLVPVK